MSFHSSKNQDVLFELLLSPKSISQDLIGEPHTISIKENRIYIRVEFRQSLGMNFVSPFQPEREFKVYKS